MAAGIGLATSRSSNGTTRSPMVWVVSWPLPASRTVSPGEAAASARAMACSRSGTTSSGTVSGGMPASTASMIAPGSSLLGLSDVTTTRSAAAAASPIRGRSATSRSPPHPKPMTILPSDTSPRVAITRSLPPGVWA